MCGICGVRNLHGQPVDVAVGQRMMDLLWASAVRMTAAAWSCGRQPRLHRMKLPSPLTRGWLAALRCFAVAGQLHKPQRG